MTGDETYPYEIGGRLIALKVPTESQLTAALKIVANARKELTAQEKLDEKDRDTRKLFDLVARILRIVDMMMISEEDREFVEDSMIAGTIELSDLIGLMGAFRSDKEEAPKNGPVKKAAKARRAS